MKTMARRLSGLARLSLAFIVALTLAAPYSGSKAYATENLPSILGNTDIDLVAYSSDAKAYSSLDEAKAALETANQNKANAEASKNEAQEALDSANAFYNQAASAHDDAVKAAEQAKAQADAAVGDAIRATQQEVQHAENRVAETYEDWRKALNEQDKAEKALEAKTKEYNETKQTYERMISEKNDSTLNQKKAELDRAQQALDEATKKLGELSSTRIDLEQKKDAAKASFEAAEKKVTSAQAKVTSASQKVSAAQSALKSAQDALEAAPKDETASYEQDVTAAQGKVNTATQEKATAESNLAAAQGELEAAKKQLAAAQQDLTNAKNNASEEPQEIKDLRAAVAKAQEAYDQAKQTNGATKGYAQAENEKNQAEQDLNTARGNAAAALQAYQEAVDHLAELSADEAASFSVPASIDDAMNSTAVADDSNGDITDPPNDDGGLLNPTDSDDPGSGGDDGDPVAQAKNTALEKQGLFNSAISVVRGKDSAFAAAKAVFDAADKCRAEEDAWADAQTRLNNALAALPPAENYDDPNHPLQVAISNALTLVGDKGDLVTTRSGELADKTTALSEAEAELERAQAALNNYHAPDNSALEDRVVKAEKALGEANAEFDSAEKEAESATSECDQLRNELNTLEQQYKDAVDAENDHKTLEITPKTTAYRTANEEFKNVARTVFGADFNELNKLMNKVNGQGGLRDQVNSAEAALPRKEKDVNTALTIYNEAGLELGYARTKLINLAKAENRSTLMNDDDAWNAFKANPAHEYYTDIEGVILNPYSVDPDTAEEGSYMALLNTHADNVTAAREAAQPFKDQFDVANAERVNAQNNFNTANANYEQAAAEVAKIEDIVRNWKDDQPSKDPTKDPDVYTPDDNKKPAAKPTAKPAAKPTADKADPKAEPKPAVEEEKATDEEVVTASQSTTTAAPAKKPVTFFGIDPLIAGIVGGAIVIAAGAAIAAAVIRRRRIAAEVVESDE